tara:strand:+ start:12798 stop:14048 length:1251 start_codon:yes stop_codon:yes gene_type:complete
MNVLHLIAGELDGGAAKGAYLLHKGLLNINVDSNIVTNAKHDLEEKEILALSKSFYFRFLFYINYHFVKLLERKYINRKKIIFSTGFDGIDLTKLKQFKNADIIHLHWINGLISLETIKNIKKPIVWSVRDLWPMTGGCHYPKIINCNYYQNECGNCKQLASSKLNDLSNKIFKKKLNSYTSQIQFVGISKWITEQAKKSKLLKKFNIKTIDNNIDTDTFYPIKKSIAKNKLGIVNKSKIILVGAQRLNDPSKGLQLFLDSIRSIENINKFFFIFFGILDENKIKKYNLNFKNYGFVRDQNILRLLYSSASVFVAPSIVESFGKTIAESMACGTPVVAFNTSGPKDIIKHKKTGYLAEAYDTKELAKGINFILSLSDSKYYLMSNAANKNASYKYDPKNIAMQYKNLYLKMLNKSV